MFTIAGSYFSFWARGKVGHWNSWEMKNVVFSNNTSGRPSLPPVPLLSTLSSIFHPIPCPLRHPYSEWKEWPSLHLTPLSLPVTVPLSMTPSSVTQNKASPQTGARLLKAGPRRESLGIGWQREGLRERESVCVCARKICSLALIALPFCSPGGWMDSLKVTLRPVCFLIVCNGALYLSQSGGESPVASVFTGLCCEHTHDTWHEELSILYQHSAGITSLIHPYADHTNTCAYT